MKKFIKFCLVGVSNTLIDYGIYFLLTRGFSLHYLLANFFSFSLAATWSFFWNKYWTFKNYQRGIFSQYLKFFLVSLGGLFWSSLFLYFFVQILNLYDLISKILVIIIVVFWNFFLNKYWTFTDVQK